MRTWGGHVVVVPSEVALLVQARRVPLAPDPVADALAACRVEVAHREVHEEAALRMHAVVVHEAELQVVRRGVAPHEEVVHHVEVDHQVVAFPVAHHEAVAQHVVVELRVVEGQRVAAEHRVVVHRVVVHPAAVHRVVVHRAVVHRAAVHQAAVHQAVVRQAAAHLVGVRLGVVRLAVVLPEVERQVAVRREAVHRVAEHQAAPRAAVVGRLEELQAVADLGLAPLAHPRPCLLPRQPPELRFEPPGCYLGAQMQVQL